MVTEVLNFMAVDLESSHTSGAWTPAHISENTALN